MERMKEMPCVDGNININLIEMCEIGNGVT